MIRERDEPGILRQAGSVARGKRAATILHNAWRSGHRFIRALVSISPPTQRERI
jgi:hypothetical protein